MKRIRARSSKVLVRLETRQINFCFALPTEGLIIPPNSTHAPLRQTATGFTVSSWRIEIPPEVHTQLLCMSREGRWSIDFSPCTLSLVLCLLLCFV
jgi:hypothetical protein